MLGKARLEVGSLIVMNDISLGQLIQHGRNFRQHFGGGGLFRSVPQAFNSVAGGLCEILVMISLRFCLTDPL